MILSSLSITEKCQGFPPAAAAQVLIDACRAGPFDGGCLIVAKALQRLFPRGEIVYLASAVCGGQAEHYGLRPPGGAILDGEGRFSSAEAWIRFWEESIGRRPLRIESGVRSDSEIPDDPRAAVVLAEILRDMR